MNFKNRTVWTGDNLDILRGFNSECVDLIYLDPPFNSKKNYSAPIGSQAAGAAFKDTWHLDDVDLAWHGEIADREPALYSVIGAARLAHGPGMQSYLIMMAVRLLELKRVLKPTGSIYLHCDPTASHYLKLLMDVVFGRARFRNEVIWSHQGSWIQPENNYPRRHDTLLFYTNAKDGYTFNIGHDGNIEAQTGIFKRWKRYIRGNRIHADSMPANDMKFQPYLNRFRKEHGRDPESNDVVLELKGARLGTVQYVQVINPISPERTGYPTQKPLALLERIIKASSNEGDIVLDPFCGCATAMVAAERLGRQWAGIDLSELAKTLVIQRLQQAADENALFKESGRLPDIIDRTDIPKRTDLGKLPNYRTHRHSLYGGQEGNCNGCLHHFPYRNMTVDHVIPQKRGGSDHIENLQLLCGACNSKKGSRSMEWLIAKLKEDGLR